VSVAAPQSREGVSLASFRTRTPLPRDCRTGGFVALETLVPMFPRLLVTGRAGSGKTTFLRLLAGETDALYVRAADAASLPHDDRLVMVDALDEVQGAPRARLLETLASRRAVVASRPFELDDARSLGFRLAALEEPEEPGVSDTMRREMRAAQELVARGEVLARILPHLGRPRSAELVAHVARLYAEHDRVLTLAASTSDPVLRARLLLFARACGATVDSSAIHGVLAQGVPVAERIALTDLLPAANVDPLEELLPVTQDLRIGRTPVTVAQYALFVADGGAKPEQWRRQLATPRHPVAHVSWHDATACCAWLAHRRGRPIALPSSAEWEAAATHPAGPYPWGAGEPDDERLNCDQRVGRTTPGGVYPRGAAPAGHLDLGGNVWEWCRDAAGDGRIVRGGGWFSKPEYARADYHYPFHAANHFHDLGFRIAERSAS